MGPHRDKENFWLQKILFTFWCYPQEDTQAITAEAQGDIPSSYNLGQAHFIVEYNQRRSLLVVTLVEALNLSPMEKEWSKPCNPYVIVQLLPDYRHQLQSTVHKKTTNPRFKETFEFEVNLLSSSISKIQLIFAFVSPCCLNPELIRILISRNLLVIIRALFELFSNAISHEIRLSIGAGNFTFGATYILPKSRISETADLLNGGPKSDLFILLQFHCLEVSSNTKHKNNMIGII